MVPHNAMTFAMIVLSSISMTHGQGADVNGCTLQVVADRHIWREFQLDAANTWKEFSSEETNRIARFNLITLIGKLVWEANTILEATFFDNMKYRLILEDIQIMDEPPECSSSCENDPARLLDEFAYVSRDAFCLSYLLTSLSFPGGKLGLAFTASQTHGGVCETFRLQKESIFGYEREVNKSLNTGIISIFRNGRRVSEKVAALTFAHEIGHSFGSTHDPSECVGDDSSGRYLMYKSGSLGDRSNNLKFSECSISSIKRVLRSIRHRDGASSCWKPDYRRGTCGNSLVEVWEECDCGRDAEQCRKECCVPPGDPLGRKPCTRASGAQCSPSEGLCCGSTCEYLSRGTVCQKGTECSKASSCEGSSSSCPEPSPLPDSTTCDDDSKVCKAGKCSGSICPSLGMLPCTPPANSTESCRPHCYSPSVACSPTPHSYSSAVECESGGGFGYCEAGVCIHKFQDGRMSWMVGVILFVIFYLIFSCIFFFIYCRYCRRRTMTINSGKSSDATSSRM